MPILCWLVPAVWDGRRTRWGNPWAGLSSARWRKVRRVSPSALGGGCSSLQTSVSPSTGTSAPRTDTRIKPSESRTFSHGSTQKSPPTVSTPSYLQGQHHQSHADHDDHQQLGGPYARRDVSEADGGERDDAEVEGVEEGEVFARSLQVLDSTCAETTYTNSIYDYSLLVTIHSTLHYPYIINMHCKNKSNAQLYKMKSFDWLIYFHSFHS